MSSESRNDGDCFLQQRCIFTNVRYVTATMVVLGILFFVFFLTFILSFDVSTGNDKTLPTSVVSFLLGKFERKLLRCWCPVLKDHQEHVTHGIFSILTAETFYIFPSFGLGMSLFSFKVTFWYPACWPKWPVPVELSGRQWSNSLKKSLEKYRSSHLFFFR